MALTDAGPESFFTAPHVRWWQVRWQEGTFLPLVLKRESLGLLGVWHLMAILPAPARVLGAIITLIKHRTVPGLLTAKSHVRMRRGVRVGHDEVPRLGLLRRS